MDYYQQEIADVYASLETSSAGLGPEEAARRLEVHGPNQLATHSEISLLAIFINQFKSFIIYILLFAVLFSLLIGEYIDTLIILAILIANALIGFFQELSANRSLEALKKLSTLQATVVRAGSKRLVDAKYLVPGDVVYLEAGDKVPADARLLEAVHLKVEESALTGESVPVDKTTQAIAGRVTLGDRRNMLFSSTAVATGHALALVTATGMATELGKIASLIKEAKEEMTPLQRRLDRFGKKLGYVIILICLVIFGLSMTKEYLAGTISLESLTAFGFIAISLAVAAVPTALPAVVTIALSIGVKRLLQKKALVRNLSSVETLGSCDVICTDKTGTLTENQMTVRHAWTLDGEASLSGTGYEPEGAVSGTVAPLLFRCGLLCNNANLFEEEGTWKISGDPTEGALLTSAAKAGIEADAERVDEIPFDSERKMMTVMTAEDTGFVIYSKGALDSVLGACSKVWTEAGEIELSAALRERIVRRNALYSSGALRVLAFAMKKTDRDDFREEGLTFIGLQAMIDPPRPDVIDSIQKTRKAGIRVIMITGDYGETAQAIGREIGILGGLLSGTELERMSEEELVEALQKDTNIFSRVAPIHKQRIVHALQGMGYTVAMTGDGVNDAPALKKADIGVAVGSGTEVAKEASDFVLLDDSFTHIVNAIEEGRGIYDNIQKSIMLLLSGNLGEVLIIFLAVISGMNLPLTAILLLWINMVTDGAPALAYSVDPYGRDIMQRPPKPRDEGILPLPKLILLLVLGSLGTAIALLLFQYFGGGGSAPAEIMRAQTMVFNFVVLYEIILTFVIRLDYQVPFFANKWVWGAALLCILLQALLMYTPLAVIFKIVPLNPQEIGALGAAGALFLLFILVCHGVKKTLIRPR